MDSILFDLDGTIGNTLPLCVAAFRGAIEPLAGKKLSDEEIFATFGPSEEGTIATLIPRQKSLGLDRYIDQYEALHHHWPDPFDGMISLLEFLKSVNVFLAMVTGKGERSTRITIEQYRLNGFFSVIKTGHCSGPVKDLRIEEVVQEYSLDRNNVLYVGDSPGDISACKKCSVRIAAAAWAPTTDIQSLEELSPDYLFTTVEDFRTFLELELA